MKRYKVEITKEALKDMEDIYTYIAAVLQAPENAMGQYNRIADAILSLQILPERVPIFTVSEKITGLRRIAVDHYSVFYLIEKDTVIVTNVLYSASDIMERLKRK